MTNSETIQEGFDVFTHDGEHAFGAVRQVRLNELTIYVENAGDFDVPFSAVKEVHAEKVILDRAKLDKRLLDAIHRAHFGEDPHI